jgi:hypothetical protein
MHTLQDDGWAASVTLVLRPLDTGAAARFGFRQEMVSARQALRLTSAHDL